MANLKTNKKGVLAQHWRDADKIQRSITFGPVDEGGMVLVNEDMLGLLWDTALAHGRATQGRRQGKPLPKAETTEPPKPEYLGVQESFDALLEDMKAREVPDGTYGGTESNLNMLKKDLGPTWGQWMTGYYGALDAVRNKNTRGARRRAANKLAKYHLHAIPDFRRRTNENKPGDKTVAEIRRDKRASNGNTEKAFLPEEATAMLAALPTIEDLAEYMRILTPVCDYMAMHWHDAYNFCTLTTPQGAEPTRINWENETYYACRQKSSTYFKNVPIPKTVMDAIRPYRKGSKLAYPFLWPDSPDPYRYRHNNKLEIAAGVTHISGRSISGWRHHCISTLSIDLSVSDVVIKALVAQDTLEGEKVAAVAGKVKDGDVLQTYQHAWPAALRAASDAFEAHMTKLIAEHRSEAGAADEGVA